MRNFLYGKGDQTINNGGNFACNLSLSKDSKSRSLFTTRLHQRGTLVLFICPTLLPTSNPTVVCVDEFAFRKEHNYGVAVMDV
jgi:hypothetical protein